MDINNKLMSAIRCGDLEESKRLIKSYGISYSKDWSEGYVLLCCATEMGHKDITKLLLINGARINSKNKHPSDTPLHFAAQNGDTEIIEMLLDRGADINAKNNSGNTPLIDSIKFNKMEIAKILIIRGANVNDRNNKGVTPLYIAVQNRCLQTVKNLIDRGARVNLGHITFMWNCYTPLHNAVENGSQQITELLLNSNANVNAKATDGETALHIAVKEGNTQIAEDLLNHGACVNTIITSTFEEGYTPLHLAVERNSPEISKLLLNNKADVNAIARDGVTTLHIAAEREHMQIVQDLLNRGAYVNTIITSTVKEGYTPLHLAVERNSQEITELLLNSNADVNAQTTNGETSLHIAARKNGDKVAKLLLSKGADIEANTKDNLTSLYIATKTRRGTIVKLLLDHGANVDAQDKNGKTILCVAAENEDSILCVALILKYRPDVNNESNRSSLIYTVVPHGWRKISSTIVAALLKYGFSVKPEDVQHRKFLHSAVKKGYVDIVKDLLTYGSDVNALYNSTLHQKKGHTLLHTATKKKQQGVAMLLINHGAVVNARDEFGRTPIFYTITNGDLNTTKLLLSNGAEIKDLVSLQMLFNTVVKNGWVKIVEIFLQHVDINGCDESGKTALHFATEIVSKKSEKNGIIILKEKKREIVQLLLSRGADANIRAREGVTPLHIAAINNDLVMVEMLLEFGADVDSKQNDGSTALHLVAENGHTEVAEALLEYGSDINSLSDRKYTPLEASQITNRFYNRRYYEYDRGICSYEVAPYFEMHIIEMKTANLHVSKENLLAIRENRNDFCRDCEEEMEIMKQEKIGNCNITFQDILKKSTNRIAAYARNENIVQFLKSDELKTKFPIYLGMLKSYFWKEVVRQVLLDHGHRSFCNLHCFPELPYNCIEIILGHLSDKELRILIGYPIRIDKDYVATCYMPKLNDM